MLLIKCGTVFDTDSLGTNGIFVYDIEDSFQRKHFFGGNFGEMAKATDNPSTIAAFGKYRLSGNDCIRLLKLENGNLSESVAFLIMDAYVAHQS